MIWIVLFWVVGLVEFGRVTYLTLASLSELPRSIAAARRWRLIPVLCGGAVSTLCFGLVVPLMSTDSTASAIAIAVGVLALLISYLAIRRIRLSIGAFTPYDLEEPFDLFISYRRTLLAERVRRMVEFLVSQGVRVWLDDYAMFATNLRYTDIREAIRIGIRNSAHAVIFDSSDYKESWWCRVERRYLETVCFSSSPDKILLRQLQDVGGERVKVKMTFQTVESERTEAEMILKELRFQPRRVKNSRTNEYFAVESNFFRDERAGYQFDAGGWEVVMRGGYFFLTDQYKGPALTSRGGSYRLNLNIDIGPSATYPDNLLSSWRQGDKYAIMRRAFDDLFSKEKPDPGISEKTLWQAGYQFARRYEMVRGVAVRGSHIFVLGKEYHYAVTYWDKRGWLRRYSIVAIDPVTWFRLEIAIGFKFFGPFLEFCARTYQMDALVHSFRRLSDN